MTSIENVNRLLRRLDNYRRDADQAVVDASNDLVDLTQQNAVKRINQPPKTGRLYRRGGVVHQASAPGESPAADHGDLSRSIETEHATLATKVAVCGVGGEIGERAKWLEFGTRKIKARPFLFKSFEFSKKDYLKLLKARLP